MCLLSTVFVVKTRTAMRSCRNPVTHISFLFARCRPTQARSATATTTAATLLLLPPPMLLRLLLMLLRIANLLIKN